MRRLLIGSAALMAVCLSVACAPVQPPSQSVPTVSGAMVSGRTTSGWSESRVEPPDSSYTPQQVLMCFIHCLRVGDSQTLCSLFVNSDPQMVAKEAAYAFCGPLQIYDEKITLWDEVPAGEDMCYMFLNFSVYDSNGAFGLTTPGELLIAYYPKLVRNGGIWKIQTLGHSSPPNVVP